MKNNKVMLAVISVALIALIGGMFMVFDINLFALKSGHISANELNNILDKDYQFVDIRTASEYNEGHINEFDINIDYYQFVNNMSMLDVLDKTKPVVIICRTGNRTEDAYNRMIDYGFEVVIEVLGGITAWWELN